MSLTMDITATEHGIVRLFAIETAQSFDHSSLTHALGIEILDPEQVDIITVSDLDELGLEGYLALGMGSSLMRSKPCAHRSARSKEMSRLCARPHSAESHDTGTASPPALDRELWRDATRHNRAPDHHIICKRDNIQPRTKATPDQ